MSVGLGGGGFSRLTVVRMSSQVGGLLGVGGSATAVEEEGLTGELKKLLQQVAATGDAASTSPAQLEAAVANEVQKRLGTALAKLPVVGAAVGGAVSLTEENARLSEENSRLRAELADLRAAGTGAGGVVVTQPEPATVTQSVTQD